MKNIVVLFLLLASCAPQKRFSNLVKNHPELITPIQKEGVCTDTIVKYDTVFIQGSTIEIPCNIDSLSKEYHEVYSDSLSILSNKLSSAGKSKPKIIIKERFFVKTDTIQYTKEVIMPEKIIENKNWMWAFIASWVVILGLLFLYWKK
jgi:hypothetical protein